MKHNVTNSIGQSDSTLPESNFILVRNGQATPIYIDPDGQDYDGLTLVAGSFAEDVRLVTGVEPEVVTNVERLDGTVILAGSVGQHRLIDALTGSGQIDVSDMHNKREVFKIQVVEQPYPGVDRAVVVAGSDKRGAIYGIYYLSELIGVSPWVYWADVQPPKTSKLEIPLSKLRFTSKEPSVQYRGFFINDEWPSFGSWTTGQFGGFNEDMYDKVFQLLLRLKGNYLWPAMWSAVFSEDGKRHAQANAELAHAYGIVMGTSHHEPMFRAGEEWQKTYTRYADHNAWDFTKNKEAITKFWEDGIIRNKDYENIVTLGMRGERDSALGGGLADNIQLLKEIIATQKELLRKHGLQHIPQMLTVYKEVEKFWHGTDHIPGLKHWDALDDVTIMLSDDNFGNMRKLPEANERNRKAGWGIYYHFDYHGGPRSYEWVNTSPLEKTWEQMSMAYDYGIRDIWIVNVGDLKPMELPLSYFMELAYDFETWGTRGINQTAAFTLKWVKQQFGHAADMDTLEGIAKVLADYTKMNGTRKPEVTYSDTYSYDHYQEAARVLEDAMRLEEEARRWYETMPDSLKDAYYQLVYYPAVASANVKKMQIYAGYHQRYCAFKPQSMLAQHYADLVRQAVETDERMQEEYNLKIAGGKWKGMMSSPHIGYTNWHSEGWEYPQVHEVKPRDRAVMIVDADGMDRGIVEGTAELPAFTNLKRECYRVTISNGSLEPFTYDIATDAEWITIDQYTGKVDVGESVRVSIDWEQVTESSEATITITGAGQSVSLKVKAEVVSIGGLPEQTFVETNGVVSMEAEHACGKVARQGVGWQVIDRYGRTLSSMKMFPTVISFSEPEHAPYLEYRLHVWEDGEYTLTVYTAPTNNLSEDSRLRYAVSFDDGEPVVADALPPDFETGYSASWGRAVLNNAHIMTTTHELTQGTHLLRFYGMDAGLVLQKLVLSRGPLPNSYFGPEESFLKSKDQATK